MDVKAIDALLPQTQCTRCGYQGCLPYATAIAQGDAAIAGDELAKNIFDFTGEILGLALANFVMFSSPEAIILFGGLTKSGDLILKPTREHMEANLIQVFQNKVKILISHLRESDAAILGASALVWEMKG